MVCISQNQVQRSRATQKYLECDGLSVVAGTFTSIADSQSQPYSKTYNTNVGKQGFEFHLMLSVICVIPRADRLNTRR